MEESQKLPDSLKDSTDIKQSVSVKTLSVRTAESKKIKYYGHAVNERVENLGTDIMFGKQAFYIRLYEKKTPLGNGNVNDSLYIPSNEKK